MSKKEKKNERKKTFFAFLTDIYSRSQLMTVYSWSSLLSTEKFQSDFQLRSIHQQRAAINSSFEWRQKINFFLGEGGKPVLFPGCT